MGRACSLIASLEWTDFGVVSVLRKDALCDTFKARALKSPGAKKGTATHTARPSFRRMQLTLKRGRQVDKSIYALKCLKKHGGSIQGAEKDAKAFAFEILVLTALSHHPNILQIKGASAGFQNASSPRIFCVLELVEVTLEARFVQWRKMAATSATPTAATIALLDKDSSTDSSSAVGSGSSSTPEQELAALATCMASRVTQIGMKIANAMDYVHANGISLGNLRPSTVGFDQWGNVKLMDFSQAQLALSGRHNPTTKSANQQHEQKSLPKETMVRPSDLPYESPESFRNGGDEYGRQPGDVYSFSILLWELITLDAPYAEMLDPQSMLKSTRAMKTRVAKRSTRPSVGATLRMAVAGRAAKHGSRSQKKYKATRQLLEDSWDRNPFARPSFVRIWLTLNEWYGERTLNASSDLGSKVAPVFSEYSGRKSTPLSSSSKPRGRGRGDTTSTCSISHHTGSRRVPAKSSMRRTVAYRYDHGDDDSWETTPMDASACTVLVQ